MNFLTKLEYLMAQRNLNKRSLAKLCNVPYTTVVSFWDKGYNNVKLSTIEKICEGLGVSIDYLSRDEITDPNYDPSNIHPPDYVPKTREAKILAVGMDKLSPERRERALKMVQLMFEQADLWEETDETGSR